MSDDPSHLPPGDRGRVLLFLAVLASDEATAGGRNASPERAAFELCRLWFDEVYTPGLRYLDGPLANRAGADVRRFEAAFTEAERAALARFHRFLELRMDMLPEGLRRQAVFPRDDRWRQIVKDAGYLLDELTPAAGRLRRDLARAVEDVLRHGPPPAGRLHAR